MKLKLLKINKNQLSEETRQSTFIDDGSISSLVVHHYDSAIQQDSTALPFIIKTTKGSVPFFLDEEFCIVIREKVDFSANHREYKKAKDSGKDIGTNYFQNNPLPPRQEHNGFIELRGRND